MGVIFGVIVIAWIAFLVPDLLSRKGDPGLLDQQTIDQFAESMQVVRRSDQAAPGFLTDSGARVSTPLTRRAAKRDLRAAAKVSVRRRRVGLLAHLVLLVVGVVVPFIAPISHWWTALPGAMLVGWLAISRYSVVSVQRMLDERRREIDFAGDEDTIVITADAPQESVQFATETERSIEITGPIGETLGSLWDPIPVTPTTYVSRPLLPRSVRTIDLAAPVASNELRVPVTADQPALIADDELPRAVGE